MFDLEQFTADCRTAIAADKSHKHVLDVVAQAVSDPPSMLRTLGEPKRAGLHKLYQSHDLPVLNVVWAPMMTRDRCRRSAVHGSDTAILGGRKGAALFAPDDELDAEFA
jgi:hypothetical protein